jgi:hypothetical protein
MTNHRIPSAPRNKTTEFIVEAFQTVTIALVGVLGILTVAAAI